MITEFAPAKLNLTLHITGRRSDGYHNLDSLVVFANKGDQIRLEAAPAFAFSLEGPQAAILRDEPAEGNLAVKAVRSLASSLGKSPDINLTLVKNLPVASGIGGGSSDAAAALRALARLWNISLDDPRLVAAAAEHGQDVAVCLKIINNYITAAGTDEAPDLPVMHAVMVNPNKGLPTPSVYKAFREGGYPFTPAARLDRVPKDLPTLITALKAGTNDLYAPAAKLMPEILAIVAALEETPGNLLSRMSGSGATCFGLYQTRAEAESAAAGLQAAQRGWWVTAAELPYRTP